MMRPSVMILLALTAVPTAGGLAAALWFGLDMASFARVIDAPGFGLSLASSVWSGAIATAVSLLLAHLAVAAAVTGNWRTRLNTLALPFLAMPHLAIGIGLALVLAPSGLLLRLVSPYITGFTLPPDWFSVQDPHGLSLIAGLVIKETAFLVLVLFAALAQVPADRLMLQARSLGYGQLKGWCVAVAPLLQKQIRLPLIAVLVFGVTNVEMAIPLGPGLPPTFSVMLWQWFTDPDPAINVQAYTGSLLLLVVTALTIFGAALVARLFRTFWRRAAESGSRRIGERAARSSVSAILGALWILGVLGVVAILLRSAAGAWRFPNVLPSGDTVSAWLTALPVTGTAATMTVLLAASTALVSVALVLPVAERLHHNASAQRNVGLLLFLPLLLPQMTFLFGVQVVLAAMRMDGMFIAVLWSHLIFALPYVWGMLAAARGAIDPRYRDIARTLGASPPRVWIEVTAPLLLRSGILAMALAFSVSVALYLPTLFAGAGRIATAATEAAAAAGSGTLHLAAMHALPLTMLPLLAFALAYTAHALVFRKHRDVPG